MRHLCTKKFSFILAATVYCSCDILSNDQEETPLQDRRMLTLAFDDAGESIYTYAWPIF